MSTITKEFTKEQLQQIIETDHVQCGGASALARIALASLEAEPVAWRCGSTVTVNKPVADDWKRRGFDFHPLYAATPAKMLEIENLEHFISFWKKVQAGQMKPGKNDIDHMVWFLEGLSNLTTPTTPVSVPDERAAFNAWNNNTDSPIAGRDAKAAAWLAWNRRAAMPHGAEPVTTAYKLPEGWVAVPVEPTENMIVEGFESEPDESFSDAEVWEAYDAMSGCQQAAHRAKLCWAAMIAAAPKPEA